jgi:N-acetylated-alpha-linked acidic dipeptidase
MHAERSLIDPEGLPERPWFRHTIYAPGFYTGYGVKTVPGVREAAEAKNFELARRQALRVVAALERATRVLTE